VVTKSNYTDPVMSSSLQNIPNGMSIYHSTSPSSGAVRNSRYPVQSSQPPSYALYETKSSSNINQKSLSPVMRGSPPANNNNSYQNAIYVKQQFYGKRGGLSADSPYGTVTHPTPKPAHHNALTSSETNLSKLFDRIHSSDESVCSSSSRDLNLSSTQPPALHHFQTYGSTSGSSKQHLEWLSATAAAAADLQWCHV
jgi:hypothetical protein